MNYRKLLCACMAALMLLACGMTALAKVPSPSKEFYYYDAAGVLSEATEGEIFFSNQLLDDACGAQIVVAAVNNTGGEDIRDYANELFNSWGIGDSKKQNGLLLLLVIDDENYGAICGDNLQPKLSSGTLNDYLERYLESDFDAGNYDAGVRKVFEALFKRVADTYDADVTTAQGIAAYEQWVADGRSSALTARAGGGSYRGNSYAEEDDGFPTGLAVIIVIALIVILISSSRRRRRQATYVTPPPSNVGAGGYRGVNNTYRQQPRQTQTTGSDWFMYGMLNGLGRSMGRSIGDSMRRSSRPSGGSRSSGSSRPSSSGGSRSFGSARGGGGHTSGGGAFRGRH